MIELMLIMAINLGISFWNARICGLVWKDIPAMGMFSRLVLYSAAFMSAAGFSSVVLVVSSGVVSLFLDVETAKLLLSWAGSLFYVMIIVPILGTGLIITLHSWMEYFRERSWMNLAVSSWNTIAQLKNSYDAYHTMGPALEGVSSMFNALMSVDSSESNSSAAVARLAIALVLLSLIGGVLLTAVIIKHYMNRAPIPSVFYEERAI